MARAVRTTVRPPRQERGRRSMDRVLDATARLLEERSFDELTVAEILRRSGQSAGGFYGRFAGKEALFLELCRRFERDVQRRVLDELATWRDLDRDQRLRRLVLLVATLNVENRGVLRSSLLRLWSRPGAHRELARAVRDPGFESLLLERLGLDLGTASGGGPDERTVRWVIGIVSAACRQELLFGALADAGLDDPRAREFLDLLGRFVVGMLGRRAAPDGRGRR